MKYGSIYLVVRDFDKSLDFYEKILEMKVSATNGKKLPPFDILMFFTILVFYFYGSGWKSN